MKQRSLENEKHKAYRNTTRAPSVGKNGKIFILPIFDEFSLQAFSTRINFENRTVFD